MVPEDLAKNRKYYPFEYIDIHGDPEHALMLFLDQNLALRDTVAYSDLRIVSKRKSEYESVLKMSELDSLAAIYRDPLRYQLFKRLTEGPCTEEELIEDLKKNEGFVEEDLNMLMLPLIRIGLVKTGWLQTTFQMGYFLVRDFCVLRTPAKVVMRIFKEVEEYKPFKDLYFQRTKEVLAKYKTDYLSNPNNQTQETRLCLDIRSQLKYLTIYNALWGGPVSKDELSPELDQTALKELIEKEFITEIKTKSDTFYALTTNIKVKKFIPKYLINQIAQKLEKNEISQEMALQHINYLSDADVKESAGF
jgi:hypothetical protein